MNYRVNKREREREQIGYRHKVQFMFNIWYGYVVLKTYFKIVFNLILHEITIMFQGGS